MRQGSIIYVEVPVRDLKRSADFYSGLFGWQFEVDETNPRRWIFTPADRGAMGAITTERPAGAGGTRLAIAVDDVAITVDRAIKLGGGPGEVVTTELGTRVDIVDPDGNHFWAFQSKLSRSPVPPQFREGRPEVHS